MKSQKPGNLVQRESEFLRPLDEADAIDKFGGILAVPAAGGGYGQQHALLVVAYRFHTNTGGLRQPSNREQLSSRHKK